MVSFICDCCQDTIKKPKIVQHMGQCQANVVCIDCGLAFNLSNVGTHISCMTEAEKYQGNLYKGPKHNGGAQSNGATGVVVDESTLRGPPWRCDLCNVTCTSKDNLVSHMQCKKHVNKAKRVAEAASGGAAATNGTTESSGKRASEPEPEPEARPSKKSKGSSEEPETKLKWKKPLKKAVRKAGDAPTLAQVQEYFTEELLPTGVKQKEWTKFFESKVKDAQVEVTDDGRVVVVLLP